MMRGILDADVFSSIVTPPTVYEDYETHVRTQSDTFYCHATDPSNVAWVDVELSSSAFESFDAESEQLALDLERLEQFVDLLPSDAPVAVNLDTSTNKATVHADQFQFESPFFAPGTVPKVRCDRARDVGVRATVSADTLFQIVDLAEEISEHLTFGIDRERLYATSSGEGDRLRMDFRTEPEIAVSTAEVEYPLDKILDICRVIPSGTELQLSFGNDAPLQLQYDLADGHGSVTFTVSPRY